MIKYILSDIEGTTTEISFVSEVLFPYFITHLNELQTTKDQIVDEAITAVKATVLEEENLHIDTAQAYEKLVFWTKTDRKHPALKLLQGIVWKTAYQNGKLKAHLYPDVPIYLNKWKENAFELGIYSSGSVQAQQLLFAYSIYGDLTPLLSNYFDTKMGHKRAESSYANILTSLGLAGNEVIFLSDIAEELDAAKASGLHTIQLLRPGNKASGRHSEAKDFEEVNQLIQNINGI